MANVTVTETTIIDGRPEYKPASGESGIKYELRSGITVFINKVTPELVDQYNQLAKKAGDDGDTRSSHQVAFERVKIVTTAPEGFDWKGCSMKVVWRIIEDFLFLSSPTPREPTIYSSESQS